MRRLDRGTLRAAGFVAFLVVVFLTVNTAVAAAADGSQQEVGGLLAPLNVTTAEGAPLDGYELGADSGSVLNVGDQIRTLLLGGIFTLVRLMVGLACWLIEFAFRFSIFSTLLRPAQKAADAYNVHVVGVLGLKGLLLGWAFVFGLILFMRGKVGQGLGEIVLTLLIAAFAASAFIRPDYLLAQGGPLDQTHQAAVEVAQITTDSYFGHHDTGNPCDTLQGPGKDYCDPTAGQAKQVAKPLQDALTNALVVKPYMLLEYGRILDPKNPADAAAYTVHLKWVKGDYQPKPPAAGTPDPCTKVSGPAKDYCEKRRNGDKTTLDRLTGPGDDAFSHFSDDLDKAGATGKAAAAYAKDPTWSRVGAVLLLAIAVFLIALMVCSMALVLLGTQGADVAATAGGGVAFVWAMLPGPSRTALWKWIAVFLVSELVTFCAAMFIPLFGIATDALLTDGPQLMIERLILLDGLALAGLAFHRRLIATASRFGERMAMRMRYAKIGGTHLPGDTSELGAALAMNGPGGGLGGPGLLGGGSGALALLGRRQGLLANLAALADGSGMPMDPGRILGDALAEGSRGLAPLGLALRGAHTALIGAPPAQQDESVLLLRQIANGGLGDGAGHHGSGGGDKGLAVNTQTGEILHDPSTDRPLLGSRIHAKASRLRAYRIASRAGRFAYGATLGLPGNLKSGRRKASQFTEDAATQLQVAANQVREDGRQWAPVGRAAAGTARFVGQTVDHQSQRLATAWQVHAPEAAEATRTFVRDTTTGAAVFVSPTEVNDAGPRTTRTRTVGPDADAPQRVFDALMRAQRESWDEPRSWAGDDE